MEIRDFKNEKKTGREYVTDISVPTINQFVQCLAEKFLDLYGPRKLLSFVQRCQGRGPWSDTIVLWKKNKNDKNEKYVYSALEYELVKKQRVFRSEFSLSEPDLKRYEELLVTMSPELMAKTDKQLMKVAKDWIAGLSSTEKS
jgi:hypothetical protein